MRLGLREKTLIYLLAGGVTIIGLTVLLVGSLQEKNRQGLLRYAAERYVQLHKERTLGGIQADLALARKMADTGTVRRWVRNPSDPAAIAPAMDELRSLVSLFSTHAAFVASKPAAAYYFVDEKSIAAAGTSPLKPAQVLTKDDKNDEWFFNTLSQKDAYNFNIDHNAKLNVTKLWINVVMKDEGVPIGVMGTGIDITKFIDEFVKTGEKGISGMYINADGAIQGHADQSLIALNAPVASEKAQSTVWKLLPDEGERQLLRTAMANLQSGQKSSEVLTLTLNGRKQVTAIAYLPPLKWYTIATLDDTTVVAGGQVLPLVGILVLILVMGGLLVFIAGNRMVVLPLHRIAEAARQVAQGDYSVRLPAGRSDEIGELSATFNKMAETLVDSQRQINFNTSAITTALQRAESFEELAQTLFTHLATQLQLGQGSLYRSVEGELKLMLCGGYARTDSGSPDREIAFGSGLVGQCALDRRAMVIEDPAAGYLQISSGLGSTAAAGIVLRPVVNGDSLLGVIELALLKKLDPADEMLIDGLLPMLAMNLEIIARNIRTGQLLEETRRQAESLEKLTKIETT